MILHIPANKPHPDENNTSSGWQKGSISGIGLYPSTKPQCMASLDPWYRLISHPDIQ